MKLNVHADAETTADAAAGQIAGLINSFGGRSTLGLAGGRTPGTTYQALRQADINWSGVTGWLSDERWVSPDHPRSNGRMAADLLMDHVNATFVRPRWSELLEPMDSAAHYEATIRSIHGDSRPDLILLGVGDDGHTASLFPGTEAIEESTHWYVSNYVPQQGEDRLTATFPLLWSARFIVLLAVGENKAQAVKNSFEAKTPAGQVGEGDAEVEWHIDAAAASLLS
jgi:6-phosphogluconolactonase